MGGGGSKSSCPSDLPTVHTPSDSHLTFYPPVLDPATGINNSNAVFKQSVCGSKGILEVKGSRGAENQWHRCVTADDMNCFQTSGCKCLMNNSDSNIGQIKAPAGVKIDVYKSWNCSGDVETSLPFYDKNTVPVIGTTQSFHISLMDDYTCTKEGDVKLTSKTTDAAKVKSTPPNATRYSPPIALIVGLGVVALLLLIAAFWHSARPKPKHLSVKQILKTSGLQDVAG